jgi:hypothetical protein
VTSPGATRRRARLRTSRPGGPGRKREDTRGPVLGELFALLGGDLRGMSNTGWAAIAITQLGHDLPKALLTTIKLALHEARKFERLHGAISEEVEVVNKVVNT